jgi:hypothetical protein
MGQMKLIYDSVCQMIANHLDYQAHSYLVELGFDKTAAWEIVNRIRKEGWEERRKAARRMKRLQRLRDDVKSQLFGHL